jgi:phenylalanyl-tRNA synthetase beta chain
LQAFATRGYHEAINFAFVDPVLQKKLFPTLESPVLQNPIASDLAAMRVSLWPGLIKCAAENLRRQQDRVRLVELGACFSSQPQGVVETLKVAGIALGRRSVERWANGKESVDFFDVKQDVEAVLAATGELDAFSFAPAALTCLHPGRSARILRHGREVGVLGELHPGLASELDFTYAPVVFELAWAGALAVALPTYREVSRFPRVRRDIAVVITESVSLSQLRERVTFVASSLLREFRVFDVYRGQGIETGRKSVALGLIFQDNSRTLTDEDADRMMASIRADLSATLGAAFRE